MSRIHVLDQTLIDKIAAGEVIVRPASVVKELVENSLDAGATRIALEADKECRNLRISDDGSGMTPEELQLAILRHATSKISALDDLWTVRTRGFRGEALASIVAVSRFGALSRPAGSVAGTSLRAEGGRILDIKPAGCPPGTTIDIRDLFFNTPARLKFMKTPAAEWGQTQTVLTRQALASPSVGFSVVYAGKKSWEAPPGQDLRTRIAQLLGARLSEAMLLVEQGSDGVEYRGLIGRPGADRADRRQQFFFVNGRPIVSPRLAAVLQDAYKGLIMTRRYPVAVLLIELEAEEVDVNVHPTKEEVRFRNENKIAGLLHRAVTAALRAANFVPTFAFRPPDGGQPAPPDPTMPLLFTRDKIRVDSSWPPAPASTDSLPLAGDSSATPPSQGRAPGGSVSGGSPDFGSRPTSLHVPDLSPSPPLPDSLVSPRGSGPIPLENFDARAAGLSIPDGVFPQPIGQVGDSYILAEWGENLLVIDQHAAHERLLYAQVCASLRSPDIQPLMVPVSFEAAPSDQSVVEELLPHLRALGIEVEPFGGRDYVVTALPSDFADLDITGVLRDLIDAYHGRGVVGSAEAVRDKALTRMACRAAIKAGQRLSPGEMKRLIEDMLTAQLPFTCPHGRPTMILLTKDQLDQQFKRK